MLTNHILILNNVPEVYLDVFISIMGAFRHDQPQTQRKRSAHVEEVDAYVNVMRCLTATAAEVERDGQQSPV